VHDWYDLIIKRQRRNERPTELQPSLLARTAITDVERVKLYVVRAKELLGGCA
jgi:hypothetical protein